MEYYALELDEHHLLIAEGLPAESSLDTGNRGAFANLSAFIAVHPDFEPKHRGKPAFRSSNKGPKSPKPRRAS